MLSDGVASKKWSARMKCTCELGTLMTLCVVLASTQGNDDYGPDIKVTKALRQYAI